jgi:sugar/nucleoside kinase (ribokinase family)
MTRAKNIRLVVVGSVGLDTIETPFEKREDLLGGSVSYACAAASFFAPVGMVGVVGDDFPARFLKSYRDFGIDLRGLRRARGKTFRWSGLYEADMNRRRTLETHLNVFESFSPDLPAAYRACPFLFLANISPELQSHVLSQLTHPRFVAADTMDLWINTARDSLMQVVARVQMLMLNDTEAQQLADERNPVRAARKILSWGPRYVVVKKGEHGALLFSRDGVFAVPAYPLETVRDPTGAGDAFAGGLMGALASRGRVDGEALRRAMAYGTVVASFGVESFSLERLTGISRRDIVARMGEFCRMVRF